MIQEGQLYTLLPFPFPCLYFITSEIDPSNHPFIFCTWNTVGVPVEYMDE